MSEENVEIVRAIFAPWGEGDFSQVEGWADPEIEFKRAGDRTPSKGIDAMRERWRDWLGAYQDFSAPAEKIIDAGDNNVLVLNRFRGRGKGSGAPVADFQGATVFTLRGGKVVSISLFTDMSQAFEAAGLSE
jgi:ketosteroid isomerase-like protein